MKRLKPDKKVFFIVLSLFVVLAVLSAILFFRFRAKSGAGLLLTPSGRYDTSGFPCYRQKDLLWSEDRLGESSFTMGSSGCLTSSIAAALSAQMQREGFSGEMTPGNLNALFTQHGVYNENGYIVWNKISSALPDAEVIIAGKPDGLEIEALVADGKYPLVKVKNHGNGAWHWVVLAGADERGYLCMDSLNKEKELVPLSVHGNMIYSMRTVWLE